MATRGEIVKKATVISDYISTIRNMRNIRDMMWQIRNLIIP